MQQEEKIKTTLFSVKEFIGENMGAIKAELTLTKYMDKGLMRWVSADSTLKLSDGHKILDLDIDFWDKENRLKAISDLKVISDILVDFTAALEKAIPEIELLEKEEEVNRELLYGKEKEEAIGL